MPAPALSLDLALALMGRAGRAAAVMALLSALTVAQAKAQSAQGSRNPLDPATGVQQTTHVSPLRTYRAASDVTVAGWPEANERVRLAGGWRAYARESAEPAASSSKALPDAPPAAHQHAAPKAGHTHHGGHSMRHGTRP